MSSIALESALLEHPAVREAAVVGASHPSGSSDIVAFVVLRDPGAVASVRQYALEQIPRAYGLRRIMPVAALPRTHNGKVLKRELRLDMRDHRSTVVY